MKNKETLEEVDENKKNLYYRKQVMNPYSVEGYSYTAYEKGFIDGYHESTKWQQEQNKNLYNEDDLEQAHFEGKLKKQSFKEWFEQFKNK